MKFKDYCIFISLAYCIFPILGLAQQKKIIDSAACADWPRLSDGQISHAGKYIAYKYSVGDKITLKVTSTDKSWSVDYPAIGYYRFVSDERLIIRRSTDTVQVISLGTKRVQTISQIKNVQIATIGNDDHFLYQTQDGNLVWHCLTSGKNVKFQKILSFKLDEKSGILTLISLIGNQQQLSLFNVKSIRRTDVGTFPDVSNVIVSKSANHVAFLSDVQGTRAKEMYFFSKENKEIIRIPIPNGQIINHLVRINKDGSKVFLELQDSAFRIQSATNNMVSVWNSKDLFIQPLREKQPVNNSYLWMIDTKSFTPYRITNQHEKYTFYEQWDDLIEIAKLEGDTKERSWNEKSNTQTFLLKVNTQVRTKIDLFHKMPFSVSPDGKFIIGYDSLMKDIRAYEVSSGKIRQFSGEEMEKDLGFVDLKRIRVAGWINDHDMLYYDDYDLFQANLSSDRQSVNLSNGYGRAHDLRLRIALKTPSFIFKTGDIQVLTAFDLIGKQNGFYKLGIDKRNPEKLIMSNNLYCDPLAELEAVSIERIHKARNTNNWLVTRQSSGSFPNYCITTSFKEFTEISDIHPEQSYKWYKTELIPFISVDGKLDQAVVYKPEDFDPNKKYPVIMHYYEQMSQRLNYYMFPKLTADFINIPWFISRGYIVCTPDIYFKAGETSESYAQSLIGAYNAVAKLSYVDSLNVGIQGHSFGGYGTNCVVTHTNVFKAAVSGSGISDLVSQMGMIWEDGSNEGENLLIYGQWRFIKPFKEDKEAYVRNSPLYYCDKVSTPTLIMANKGDVVVNASQGIEFFTALRRYKQHAWLLQYKNGNHGLDIPADRMDYTRKIESFFGYFLKDESMPNWMMPQ